MLSSSPSNCRHIHYRRQDLFWDFWFRCCFSAVSLSSFHTIPSGLLVCPLRSPHSSFPIPHSWFPPASSCIHFILTNFYYIEFHFIHFESFFPCFLPILLFECQSIWTFETKNRPGTSTPFLLNNSTTTLKKINSNLWNCFIDFINFAMQRNK